MTSGERQLSPALSSPAEGGDGPTPAEDPLLFGANPTPGVVAVELDDARRAMTLWRRVDGALLQETRAFSPWLLAQAQADLPGATWERLPGEGFCWRARFDGWADCEAARRSVAEERRLCYGSAVKQFLVDSGITLFKGLAFDDLHRLQLDLETATLAPAHPQAAILLAALSDNRGWHRVIGGDEREIVEGIVAAVRERDPDVIEGHNLYGFDLPYLAARASALSVALALGRDGSPLAFGRTRNCAVGGTTRPFVPAFIRGRHLIDTLLSSQRFDWVRGEMESYNLKEVARVLGVAEPDRELVDRAAISEILRQDPDRVSKYAMQDVIETRRVCQVVGGTDFYVAQMVPESYQDAAVSGTGGKIDALLIREYLRRGEAIPLPRSGRPYAGGYTECRVTGVLRDVAKVDVESLYPSLMLSRGIAPAADRLGIFLPMLRDLTARRLDAKARVRTAPEADRRYWDGLQGSFKILINSFFGYMGATSFRFNDPDAASAVTAGGQEVVRQITDALDRTDSRVIEVDTDGVYFQPPPGLADEEAVAAYVTGIASTLPDGIRLAYEGRYAVMVSLKIKNYVLVGYDGERTFKGSALRSRSDEAFGRRFLSDAIDLLVAGRAEELGGLYRDLLRRIQTGQLPPAEFCRRERVTENTFGEALKKRWAALLGDLRVGDYVSVYRRQDGSLGLCEQHAQDEDRGYLADKLYKFAGRLRGAVGDEFDRLFPSPKDVDGQGRVAVQSTFDFGA